MKWISVFALIFSSHCFANHLETVCKSALQPYPGRTGYSVSNPPVFSPNYVARGLFTDSGRVNIVEDLSGQEIYQADQKIRGLVEAFDSLWLLVDYEMINISKEGELIGRYPFVFNPNPQTAKGVSLVRVEDLLLIARGSAGLSAFNMRTGKLQWHKDFNEVDDGKPVAVTFDGEHAQVVFTSTRENGFSGIVTLNLESQDILFKTPYNQRRAGVIAPDVKAHWFNDSLILNNGGWIHLITRNQIETQKPFRPKWVAVEVGGDRHLHYMMLTGDFFIKDQTLVGCGLMNERNGDQVTRFARLFQVQLD